MTFHSAPAPATPHLGPVLFTAEQIRVRVDALADEIARDYGPGELAAVAVLKGSFIFLADLARRLSVRGIHLTIDFMSLSSYGAGTAPAGPVQVQPTPPLRATRGPVLLVDDILDTGLTLQTARELLSRNGITNLRTCVLLDKPARRRVPANADYVGFQVENVFVVGYGLDYNDAYRHLPYLAALVAGASRPDRGTA